MKVAPTGWLMKGSHDMSPGQRARFLALRRYIFAEMAVITSRWRVFWVLPYNALVLYYLVTGGADLGRILAQGACTAIVSVLSLRAAYRARQGIATSTAFHGWTTAATTLVSIGVTGGVASPFLVLIVPPLVVVTMTFEDRRFKWAYSFVLMGILMAYAYLDHTNIGVWPAPLAPDGVHASSPFVILAAGAGLYAVSVLTLMSETFTLGYERLAQELAATREELFHESEERTLALEGIAARLAHEVKNPLAAIKGLSTLMARSAADPKMAERLGVLASEADRLQSIVDGFLSFSRGLDDLRLGPVRPMDVVREIVVLLEARSAEMGITLTVAGDSRVRVEADGRKLRQVLLNLVLNAMQASPRGSRVQLEVGAEPGNGALLRVIDEGKGMTQEVLERIKKPYFTTREGGSGLGVAIARGLVEQHGGRMTYESTPGKGTTVTIQLPNRPEGAASELAHIGRLSGRSTTPPGPRASPELDSLQKTPSNFPGEIL